MRSIFWSLPCQGRSEVLRDRQGGLLWLEVKIEVPAGVKQSKSERSTSVADGSVRNSSHPWSALGFFAGEDCLVVARCCFFR